MTELNTPMPTTSPVLHRILTFLNPSPPLNHHSPHRKPNPTVAALVEAPTRTIPTTTTTRITRDHRLRPPFPPTSLSPSLLPSTHQTRFLRSLPALPQPHVSNLLGSSDTTHASTPAPMQIMAPPSHSFPFSPLRSNVSSPNFHQSLRHMTSTIAGVLIVFLALSLRQRILPPPHPRLLLHPHLRILLDP